MKRPVILVETPFRDGGTDAIRYLAWCLFDSVRRGEAPIASHAIYPLCLPEDDFLLLIGMHDTTGREIGLACRDAIAQLPGVCCVRYIDLGSSAGMVRAGVYLEDRVLPSSVFRMFFDGRWPSKARWSSSNC